MARAEKTIKEFNGRKMELIELKVDTNDLITDEYLQETYNFRNQGDSCDCVRCEVYFMPDKNFKNSPASDVIVKFTQYNSPYENYVVSRSVVTRVDVMESSNCIDCGVYFADGSKFTFTLKLDSTLGVVEVDDYRDMILSKLLNLQWAYTMDSRSVMDTSVSDNIKQGESISKKENE